MPSTDNAKGRELRTRVERWLREENDNVTEHGDPAMSWTYLVQSHGRSFLVGKPVIGDRLLIAFPLPISDAHRAKFNDLSRDDRATFLMNTFAELLKMGVSVEGMVEPFQQVVVSSHLFLDPPLSRDRFEERLRQAYHAALVAKVRLVVLLGEVQTVEPIN